MLCLKSLKTFQNADQKKPAVEVKGMSYNRTPSRIGFTC